MNSPTSSVVTVKPRKQMTPYDKCVKAVKRLNQRFELEYTFGYLGNSGSNYDDRSWYIFIPHPGRVGTATDRMGGFATDELDQMFIYISGVAAGMSRVMPA